MIPGTNQGWLLIPSAKDVSGLHPSPVQPFLLLSSFFDITWPGQFPFWFPEFIFQICFGLFYLLKNSPKKIQGNGFLPHPYVECVVLTLVKGQKVCLDHIANKTVITNHAQQLVWKVL